MMGKTNNVVSHGILRPPVFEAPKVDVETKAAADARENDLQTRMTVISRSLHSEHKTAVGRLEDAISAECEERRHDFLLLSNSIKEVEEGFTTQVKIMTICVGLLLIALVLSVIIIAKTIR